MPSSPSTPMSDATLESPYVQVGTTRNRAFTLSDLDIKDTTILKGLAIIAIVLHNFFHFVSPTHQNEFTFDPARFPIFLHTVLQPSLAIQAIFTFFGHFGVQVFVFLSAYGLAKSHWDDRSTWPVFMWGRIKKLYPAVGLVVLPWFIFVCIFGASGTWHSITPEFVCMLLGISTLIGFGLPEVGPWWFIPFIIQFYALWLPMRNLAKRAGWRGLLVLAVLCLAAVYAVNPLLLQWNINLLHTPVGRMKGLCLGIAAARYPIRITGLTGALLVFSGTVVLILGSIYYAFFPISFMGATFIWLWAYAHLRGILRRVVLLESIGRYSMLIFLLNGIVRKPFLIVATTPTSQLICGAFSAVLTFLLAGTIHELLLSPQGLMKKFRSDAKRPQTS